MLQDSAIFILVFIFKKCYFCLDKTLDENLDRARERENKRDRERERMKQMELEVQNKND